MKTTSFQGPMKWVMKTLEWCMDHGQEDRRVSIGCRDCKESHNMMAATAYTCWVSLHKNHQIWMKNPFKKRSQ